MNYWKQSYLYGAYLMKKLPEGEYEEFFVPTRKDIENDKKELERLKRTIYNLTGGSWFGFQTEIKHIAEKGESVVPLPKDKLLLSATFI